MSSNLIDFFYISDSCRLISWLGRPRKRKNSRTVLAVSTRCLSNLEPILTCKGYEGVEAFSESDHLFEIGKNVFSIDLPFAVRT